MIHVEIVLDNWQKIQFALPWTDMGFTDKMAMEKINALATALYGSRVITINYQWVLK